MKVNLYHFDIPDEKLGDGDEQQGTSSSLFKDEKCVQGEYGLMRVVTEKPFYHAGLTVHGLVYLSVDEALDTCFLRLEIKGTETASMKTNYVETHSVGQGDDMHDEYLQYCR